MTGCLALPVPRAVVHQMKAFVAHAEATFGAGVDIMVNNGTHGERKHSVPQTALTKVLPLWCPRSRGHVLHTHEEHHGAVPELTHRPGCCARWPVLRPHTTHALLPTALPPHPPFACMQYVLRVPILAGG